VNYAWTARVVQDGNFELAPTSSVQSPGGGMLRFTPRIEIAKNEGWTTCADLAAFHIGGHDICSFYPIP
jgi:hypothetical protein